MTKEPVRAMVLSLLAPLGGAKVLEIGTGTGGMTVELLRAAGESGTVVTMEVSLDAAAIAEANVERLAGGRRARVIRGAAPEEIPEEPFDAVFIGGHGGELEGVMRACWERLRPGGRMLLTAVTPGTTARSIACMEELGAEIGFWRVAPAVGRKTGREWLLFGINPVDLIWGDK